jgi:hypothetical protein
MLEAWPAMLDTAGIYIPVSTQAAAQVIATQAIAADPKRITPALPAVFFINGAFFYADGTQDTSGTLRIRPAGSTSGILYRHSNTYNDEGSGAPDLYVEGSGTISLDFDTTVEFYLESCMSGKGDGDGSVLLGFRVDGEDIYRSEVGYDRVYATHTIRWVADLPAGTHTVAYTTQWKWGVAPVFHYQSGAYPGRRFTVTSLGLTA